MTESLLMKLEEKAMTLLSELETLRKENATLRAEKEKNSQKLAGLVSLLDTLSSFENEPAPMVATSQTMTIVDLQTATSN